MTQTAATHPHITTFATIETLHGEIVSGVVVGQETWGGQPAAIVKTPEGLRVGTIYSCIQIREEIQR